MFYQSSVTLNIYRFGFLSRDHQRRFKDKTERLRTQAEAMAMFEPKMNPDYSHVNSDNFELFLSPNVARLKDSFSKYK